MQGPPSLDKPSLGKRLLTVVWLINKPDIQRAGCANCDRFISSKCGCLCRNRGPLGIFGLFVFPISEISRYFILVVHVSMI